MYKRLLLVFTLFLPFTQNWAMDITVLGLFSDRAILKVDDKQHMIKVGEKTPEGIKLISANSEKAVLEVNGKQDSYSLGTHISSHYETVEVKGEASIWPVRGMYVTTGTINGHPVTFMVDTGATWISMSGQHAKRLGIDYRVNGKRRRVSTANGVIPVFVVNLDRVKVGDIELHHVEAAVADADTGSEILLGMSFLQRVNIERKGQVMMLKRKW
ncbi:MAG: retroviral-like aspartic protease family protein [Gammaproteobacteria bacterium]|nr:retroviral-like aspartic protease family protein [Gammaproteobacteria bacterium]